MSGRSFSFWGGTLENTERNANILHRHLCSRDIFYASFLLLRQFGQKRITGYKICPGVHDLLLKFVKRIEANYISPPDKFSGNRQHRIGVAMRRNTKECQQKFDCWIIKEKMVFIYRLNSYTIVIMPYASITLATNKKITPHPQSVALFCKHKLIICRITIRPFYCQKGYCLIAEKMLYCRYGKSIEPKAALPFLFFRRVSSSPPDEKRGGRCNIRYISGFNPDWDTHCRPCEFALSDLQGKKK